MSLSCHIKINYKNKNLLILKFNIYVLFYRYPHKVNAN